MYLEPEEVTRCAELSNQTAADDSVPVPKDIFVRLLGSYLVMQSTIEKMHESKRNK